MTATDSYVGGIAGVNIGTIEKCVAGGNLSVTQANGNSYQVYLGGIAGRIEQFGNMGGYVKQCAFTGTLRVTGGTAVTGQICAQVNANVLNSAIGLNGHVSDCYGKNGQGALIGTNTEQTLTTGGVLTAEQMKNPNSYKGWSFDGDWQISKDGLPERADASAIRSLSVSGVPKECYVGEVPAYWGRLIVNNSTSVTITKDMIAGFENSETGTRELTINYKGKQTSWSMTVEKPSASDITSIVLSGHPKTTYSENQKFDPSGASFFATIGGRYVYIYSGFSYDKTGPLKSEDTSVIFNYFGKEIPVSITVTARKAKKLSVLAAPAKTQFTVGNTLDLSGVKLQITYNDGTQTPIFKADELEKYGVHVAFGKNGSFTTVAADKVLESDDSGSTIVFYATDKLPSEYGSVVVASSTITVRSPLTVPALDLYVSVGKSAAQYLCTDNVTGGSGTYATTVIEEKLPAGLNRTNLPGEKYNAFGYTGVVTASAGDYSSQYKISDTETQESIQVTVTIHVVPSDQAAFYSFVLKKVENPGLKQDVIGAIGEDTIVLRVPKGTNVTKLKPSIDYGSGMGTGLSSDFWNGSTHDFTSPVVYTLTAPDGVTKKSYTVSVEFYDDTSEEVQSGDEILSPADNAKISCKDSEEIILKGWAGDSSREISLFKYVVNGISYTTSANATTQTIPNARAYEVKISGSSLKEGNNTLEIWVMYADNSGTGSGGTLKKLGTRTVVKEGHKAVKDAAVAATCETTGKTEGSHCSVCNTVIKAQTTTAALGHSWDGGKVTKAATCTTAGTKIYTCTRCKKTRTETIAATGHKAVKDAAVAATCETAGKTEGSHCSVCNTVIKAQTTVAALGHSWDGGKVTKAATCTAAGTKTYTCTRCKKTRTETIAATGHKVVKDAAVAATCETTGKTEGSHCSVCGTVLKSQTTIAALGHSWDGGKVTKAATCTTAGTKTYTCTRCKKTRTETIAATGHKVVKDAAVAATCETTGKTEGSHCSVCGTVLKAQTTTAALGHDYGEWKTIKAATYTEPGQAERVCRRNASHKEYRQLPILEKAKIDLSACSIQLSEQTYVYDGTEKTPTVTITYNEKTLTEGKDYQVYFADNVNPGTAKITAIAKTDSDYTGTATITFEIRKSLPENATVIEPGAFSNCTNLVDLNIKENVTEIGDNAFADSKNLQNIYFYGNSPKLGNNIFKNVTATVYYPYTDKTWSLDILQDYGGNITWVPWDPKTNSPAKRSLALCDIKITEQKYTYDGTEKTPEMVIMDGNYTLQKNTDYTVKCSNNTNAGNAELEITGAGNYSGTYKAGFLIEQTEPSLKFDKKTITVKYGTKPFLCVLSEKTTDGTITYSSSNPKVAAVDPSTGKVTIKGGGTAAIMAYAAKGTNYTSGSTFCTIKVTKRSNTIKASNIRRTWYAKARKISINAKASGKAQLKYSSSSKSVKVDKQGRITIAAKFTGSARITIRSSATAGYNAATKSITVTVNPAGTTLTTAKNLSGRKAQITWKKNRYVTGYEIQYSVNKNFRSGSKKTVAGVSKTKYTLTKLQKNKTYYVRIRTYKKSGTKKYYSSWSKVKAVRIRK